MSTVEIALGERIEVRLTTFSPVFRTSQTASFRLATRYGLVTELGLRFCYGELEDTYLWDGFRRIRNSLPPSAVAIGEEIITTHFPWEVLPPMHSYPALRASLTLNGGIVESDIEVSLAPLADVAASTRLPHPVLA